MKVSRSLFVAGLSLCFGVPVAAQNIGVLQSAETMNRGTFKLMVAPVMEFGKNGTDDEFGVAARGGYGFTDRFDAEAKLGFFDNGTIVGADGEFWILKNEDNGAGLDFSLSGGVHWMFADDEGFDTMGFEIAPLLSGNISSRLELCGALSASFESIGDAPAEVDDSFTILHLVPGVEYRLSDRSDLVGEVGIGLNDDSFNYASVGVAFYLRQ